MKTYESRRDPLPFLWLTSRRDIGIIEQTSNLDENHVRRLRDRIIKQRVLCI
jgi:hypothetical protein